LGRNFDCARPLTAAAPHGQGEVAMIVAAPISRGLSGNLKPGTR